MIKSRSNDVESESIEDKSGSNEVESESIVLKNGPNPLWSKSNCTKGASNFDSDVQNHYKSPQKLFYDKQV